VPIPRKDAISSSDVLSLSKQDGIFTSTTCLGLSPVEIRRSVLQKTTGAYATQEFHVKTA
jgi:hypothetical protein